MHGRARAALIATIVFASLALAAAVALAAGRPDAPGSGNPKGTPTQAPANPGPNGNANANANGQGTATSPGGDNAPANPGPPADPGSQGQGNPPTDPQDQHRQNTPAAADADVTPSSGTVKVTLPGSASPVALAAVQHLPAGTLIDATQGSVTLDGPDGKPGTFTGGAFVVRKTTGPKALTVLQLTGGDFSKCPPRSAKKAAVQAAGRRGRAVRRLWGRDNHGRFGTQGRDASASVRGTVWLTEDRCDGTSFTVRQGSILVRDAARHRTVVVRAGHSYLVRHKR